MTLSFPTDLTIDSCEEFIFQLSKYPTTEPLNLPVEVNRSAFGGLAAAIQAINTWGRGREQREIVLGNKSSIATDQINEVIIRPHKFCAAMLAKKITDAPSEADLRPAVNNAAREAIEMQANSKFGQRRGSLCWFAFVDHSTKGFDKNFYTQPSTQKPQPRKPAQIQSIIQAMVEKSIDVLGATKQLSNDDIDDLGRIFFELFSNSHEHGTKGETRSDWLKPGQRVIYSNGISLSEKAVEKRTQHEKALSAYLLSQQNRDIDKNRFIEISIIDSGLGYFHRWCLDHPELTVDDSLASEYSILKRCFTSRQTSSDGINKGHGLPVVMDRLTKLNGFMRVRSGRLSLYRDFVSQPYEPNDQCDFFDWPSEKPALEILSELPHVVGVAITLLIPLEAK